MHRARLTMDDRARDAVRARNRTTLGVMDVGSNTARFVVFEVASSRTIRAIFETKDAPRLGLDPRPDGRLTPESIARGVATVKRFAKLVRALEVPKTLAVATSAVRDAPNGMEFVREAERSTGVLLRIIPGTEEARYDYLGVAGAWELENDIVLDLGGGSLQLAEVRDGHLHNSVSLPLGALRLSQRFFRHDPPKRREWDEIREYVRSTVTSAFEAFGGTPTRLFGIGGTVRALARATIELREWPVRRVHGYTLYDHDLEALTELMGEMTAAKRRAIPGIGGDRADVVLAGIVVLKELLRAARADRIIVSGTGIREGIALESIGAKLPVPAEELAERSAAAAAETLSFPFEHGRAVAETALALFEVLGPRLGAGRREALALRVAAWMHDSGIAIDVWNHAVHSAYLIQNYPIWGLDPREVLLASMATYLHEGDDPPSQWKKAYLPLIRPADLDLAMRLGAILEVAEIVTPGRPRFSLGGGGRTLSITLGSPADAILPPRWAEKVKKPMERIFGLEVRLPHA